MKTITIEDAIYKQLLDAKVAFHARSFSEVLRKILSKDRTEWAFRMAGKVRIDEKKISELDRKWKAWHTP